MPETDPNVIMILGEVRGQLREIIHTMNNQSMKNDAVAKQLAKLEGVPEQLSKLDARMTALEQDRYRRDGAMGIGAWLMRTPLLGWVVGICLAAWAYYRTGVGG